MKIDFSQKLVSFNGEDIINQNTQSPLTVGSVCIHALLVVDNDNPISGEMKAKHYKLAKDIHAEQKEEISDKEAELLKKLVGLYFSPLIVGQVYNILDSA